jgi:hypothetical protein
MALLLAVAFGVECDQPDHGARPVVKYLPHGQVERAPRELAEFLKEADDLPMAAVIPRHGIVSRHVPGDVVGEVGKYARNIALREGVIARLQDLRV